VYQTACLDISCLFNSNFATCFRERDTFSLISYALVSVVKLKISDARKMSNCTRRKNQDDKEEAASSAEPRHALSETSPSPLINFLLEATKQLQDEKADVLPVLRVLKLFLILSLT